MLVQVYSIRDRKAESFMQPFFSLADGMAARSFSDMVNDPGQMVARHPEDFDLYAIGQFDDTDGRLVGTQTPRFVVAAATLKKGAPDAS